MIISWSLGNTQERGSGPAGVQPPSHSAPWGTLVITWVTLVTLYVTGHDTLSHQGWRHIAVLRAQAKVEIKTCTYILGLRWNMAVFDVETLALGKNHEDHCNPLPALLMSWHTSCKVCLYSLHCLFSASQIIYFVFQHWLQFLYLVNGISDFVLHSHWIE